MTRLWPIAQPEALALSCVVVDSKGCWWYLWNESDDGFDAYPVCCTGEINADAITLDYALRFSQCHWDLSLRDHRAKAVEEFLFVVETTLTPAPVQALQETLDTDDGVFSELRRMDLLLRAFLRLDVDPDELFEALTWAREVTSD